MPPQLSRISPLAALAAFLSIVPAASAGNVDPGATGARHAWGENVGWLEAAPALQPQAGAQVADTELTGYVWQENVGWISLSCRNTDGCGAVGFGVRNDGAGKLSGEAWSENAGWILFDPKIQGTPVPGAGVRIDPVTGRFQGLAWSENLGWLDFTFSAPGLAAYQMQTSWRPASASATPSATPSAAPTPAATQGPTRTPAVTGTPSGSPSPTPAIARVPASGARARWAMLLALLLMAGLRVRSRGEGRTVHRKS
jgi:cell division septation protein DedD